MGNSTSGCCKIVLDKEANGEPPPAIVEEPLFIPKHLSFPRETSTQCSAPKMLDAGVQAAPQACDWHHDAHLPLESTESVVASQRPQRNVRSIRMGINADSSVQSAGLFGLDGLDDIVERIYLFCFQDEVCAPHTVLCLKYEHVFDAISLCPSLFISTYMGMCINVKVCTC
jgi:hypothetical protein